MVVGTLSLVQKGQPVGAVDAVHSGCSGIVVYGGGDNCLLSILSLVQKGQTSGCSAYCVLRPLHGLNFLH